MVRRPRDDEVVERHLAERGLRHVHGDARRRRVPARLGALDRRSASARTAAFDTDALGSHPPDRVPGRCRPTDAEGMFDVLTYEKGARRRPHARAVPRRGRVPRRASATTCRRHAYGNTETTDLWDAHRGGHRRAGAAHHGHLDLPGRLPARLRASGRRLGRPSCSASGSSDTSAPTTGRGGRCRSGCAGPTPPATCTSKTCSSKATRRPWRSAASPPGSSANRGAAGFYRTDYAPDLRAALAEVAIDVLDATERYTLVDDTWAAVLGGTATAAEVVESDPRAWPTTTTSRCGGASARCSSPCIGSRPATMRQAPQSRSVIADVVGPLLARLGDVDPCRRTGPHHQPAGHRVRTVRASTPMPRRCRSKPARS